VQSHRSRKNLTDAQRDAYLKAVDANHEAVTGDYYKGFAHDSASADSSAGDRRGRFHHASPMPAGSTPRASSGGRGGGGGGGESGPENGNDDEEADKRSKDEKRRNQLVDPNKCAKAFATFELPLKNLDTQITKARSLYKEAAQVVESHKEDRVFSKLKEGLDIRYKIFCFLTSALDSEECCELSSRPAGAKAWTLEQELEALEQKELRYVPVSITEMVHRNALNSKLDDIFESATNGELADMKKAALEAVNACKKIVTCLEKQAQEILASNKKKKNADQAQRDKERKAQIEASARTTQEQQKQAEDRAKVLQEQKEAAHRAKVKQAPTARLWSVCVDAEVYAGGMSPLKLTQDGIMNNKAFADPELQKLLDSLGASPVLISGFSDIKTMCSEGPSGASLNKFKSDYPTSGPMAKACRVTRSTPDDVGGQIHKGVVEFLKEVPHFKPIPPELKSFAYTSWFANRKGMKHIGLDGVALPSIRVHFSGQRDVWVVRMSELYPMVCAHIGTELDKTKIWLTAYGLGEIRSLGLARTTRFWLACVFPCVM